MPASTSQRRTKPKVRRNSDVISAVSLFMLCKTLEPFFQRGSDKMKLMIRKVSSVSLGVYMFHLLLVNLTLGGPIGGFITLGQTHPFIKAIVAYALTGIAVYIGKWIIAKIKQIASSRVVPEKLRTLDHGRPWSDDQFASTRLSSNRDMSR